MKKVKFLSSLNAKLALAAVLLAGFTFTSCEEEDLSVTSSGSTSSTSGTITTVDLVDSSTSTTVDLSEGVAYLSVYVEDNSGNSLDDEATVTIDGTEETTHTYTGEEGGKTVEVIASATGYNSTSKSVLIPTLSDGQCYYITTTVTLVAIGEDETDVEIEEAELTQEDVDAAEDQEEVSTVVEGEYEAGVIYTVNYTAEADQVGFLTDDQKEELYAAIETLTETNTTAYVGSLSASAKGIAAYAVSDLQTAKDRLKAAVLNYKSHPGYQTNSVTLQLSAAATQITISYIKSLTTIQITFTTTVNDVVYTVIGQQSMYTATTLSGVSAYDEETGHTGSTTHVSHSTAHGDDENAGGGTSGE